MSNFCTAVRLMRVLPTGSTLPSIGSGTATAIGGVMASFVGMAIQRLTLLAPTTPRGRPSTIRPSARTIKVPASSSRSARRAFKTSSFRGVTAKQQYRRQIFPAAILDQRREHRQIFRTATILTAPATFIRAFRNSLAAMPGVNNNSNFHVFPHLWLNLKAAGQRTGPASGLLTSPSMSSTRWLRSFRHDALRHGHRLRHLHYSEFHTRRCRRLERTRFHRRTIPDARSPAQSDSNYMWCKPRPISSATGSGSSRTHRPSPSPDANW